MDTTLPPLTARPKRQHHDRTRNSRSISVNPETYATIKAAAKRLGFARGKMTGVTAFVEHVVDTALATEVQS